MEGDKKTIAKQFELPERQSKIATLLKQTDETYCICRSTDSTSFMIACDNCEDWFHGHCIGINETESKNIKHYYCPGCCAENPELRIEYKKVKGAPPPAVGGGGGGPVSRPEKRRAGRPPLTRRDAAAAPLPDAVLTPASPKEPFSQINEPATPTPPVPAEAAAAYRPSRRQSSGRSSQKYSQSFDSNIDRQCHAPNCQESARDDSKYCSTECGIALASARLYLILPSRLQEWTQKKSIAEQHNDRDLEVVKKKQESTLAYINEIQQQRNQLDEHIARVQRLTYDPQYEDDEDDEEGVVCCISCGRDISTRDAIKHMEKCYNKYEAQMSFGSLYKTTVEGTPLFCDFLNPSTKTYCKRLQVLCAEHTKEPKVRDTEICGCPVDNKVRTGGRFCRNKKKNCNKHLYWEKSRRGELDLERIRQFMKMDDMYEQERQLLQAKHDRGGVMGLLLNSTFDHELEEQVLAEQAERERMDQLRAKDPDLADRIEYERERERERAQRLSRGQPADSDDDEFDEGDAVMELGIRDPFRELKEGIRQQQEYERQEHQHQQQQRYEEEQRERHNPREEIQDLSDDEDMEINEPRSTTVRQDRARSPGSRPHHHHHRKTSKSSRDQMYSSSSSSGSELDDELYDDGEVTTEDSDDDIEEIRLPIPRRQEPPLPPPMPLPHWPSEPDDFVHLPSKREKARIKTVSRSNEPEMTASRLNRSN